MGFKSVILVVEDVIKSRKLYEEILGCKITDDFGIYNIGLCIIVFTIIYFKHINLLPTSHNKHTIY